MKTISIREYLESEKGGKFVAILKEQRDWLARQRCGSRTNARDYLLLEESSTVCSEVLPGNKCLDFDVDARIMDCDPMEVFKSVCAWMASEYAMEIYSGNDDFYNEEVKAMFGNFLPDEEDEE